MASPAIAKDPNDYTSADIQKLKDGAEDKKQSAEFLVKVLLLVCFVVGLIMSIVLMVLYFTGRLNNDIGVASLLVSTAVSQIAGIIALTAFLFYFNKGPSLVAGPK